MSTELENLKAELAALAGRIAALETVEQPEAEWPKDGDTYFFIDGDGDVLDSRWDSDLRDTSRMNIGNVFRTVAEAEHEIERRKVLTELRRLAKASWGGTKIDWTDGTQYKWQIRFAHDTADGGKFDAINWRAVQYQSAVAFATEQAAQAAIKTIGADRLMLLLED